MQSNRGIVLLIPHIDHYLGALLVIIYKTGNLSPFQLPCGRSNRHFLLFLSSHIFTAGILLMYISELRHTSDVTVP